MKPVELYVLGDWLDAEEEFIRETLKGIREGVSAWREHHPTRFRSNWDFICKYIRGVQKRRLGFDGHPIAKDELVGIIEIIEEIKREEHRRSYRRDYAARHRPGGNSDA